MRRGQLGQRARARLHLLLILHVLEARRFDGLDATRAPLETAIAFVDADAAPAVGLVFRRGIDVRPGDRQVGGAAKLFALPEHPPASHPLAVRQLRIALARRVLSLVLLPVSADSVVHVQRAAASNGTADDVLLREVAGR